MRNDFCSNYLEHSAKGTTWKAGVQYLKKIPLGNDKYYYIYTQEELNAWNKKHSTGANNVLSNKERDSRKQMSLNSGASVDDMVRNGLKVKGQNAAEKTANMEKNIAVGEKQIQKVIANTEASDSKKSKSSSGSSGSSKKSSGSKSGSSKSKSSKEKSGSTKEKTGGSSKKEKKEKTEKTATKKNQTQEYEAEKIDPITIDSLNKAYKGQGSEMNSFNGSSSDFKKYLLDKYDDGAFGYLSAGSKVYKFVIEDGDVILKDYGSNREVSFDSYLKSVKSYKEFQANKKKN